MFRRLAEEGAAATRESLAKAGPLDLVEESRRAFADFAPDIAGAAVFLDDGAAETVHYACGASFLLGLGAKNVFALPAASAATTTERFPDDRTNSTTVGKSGESSNDRDPETDPPDHRLAPLLDVTGAPLPKDTRLVIFTHRLLKNVANDVLELVKQRPETSKILVAVAATAEAHEADARAAARAAGASVSATNEIARDAKAKQERALRIAVKAILKNRRSASERDARRKTKTNAAEDSTNARVSSVSEPLLSGSGSFAAADWGDWGSETDEVEPVTKPRDVAADDDADEDENFVSSRFATAYFPAPFVPLSAGAFVLPADSAAATASLRSLSDASQTSNSKRPLCPSFEDGTEEDGGDAPAPAGVGVIAATLAQMGFSSFGFSRFECFAIGRVARAVARAVSISGPPLESHASERQRHDNRPCALLLVDRVADLLTPAIDEAFVGNDDDAFLAAKERVGARRLPVFSRDENRTDAFFARADASFVLTNEAFRRKRAVAWAHPNDAEARRFVEASTRRTLPQTAVAARRWVADAAREEGVVFKTRRENDDDARKNAEDAYDDKNAKASKNANANARVSASELRSMLEPFLDDPRVRLRRGAMTHAVAIVAECLEKREDARATASAEVSDASASPAAAAARSFAAAVREMTRDAARAVDARAGEGAAAAAVANSLRRTLESATRAAKETHVRSRREEDDWEGKKKSRSREKDEAPPLALASAATLAVAAYALAGEAAAHERNALGLGQIDFSSLEEEASSSDEEEDEAFNVNEAFNVKRDARDVARAASHASPFGRGDETLLRDALADFVVAASASRTRVASEVSSDKKAENSDARTSDAEKEDEKEKEERRKLTAASLDWLGSDLAARLVERAGSSRATNASFSRNASASTLADEEEEEEEDFESRALLLETRDGVERFVRRLGDVARARRRYASCGGLLDFAEASALGGFGTEENDVFSNRHHHRSLLKELAERVSVGADGGEGRNEKNTPHSYSAFVDVAHVASSLGGFLKSGVGAALGTFGLRGPSVVSSPKPSDSPTVLIFVLGGITAREIRDVRAAAADVVGNAFSVNENGAKVEDIVVGSTGLLRASGEDLVAMVV
jgi:hypothetical protein